MPLKFFYNPDCKICASFALRLKGWTGLEIEICPLSEWPGDKDIPKPSGLEDAVRFIDKKGIPHGGAGAILGALAASGHFRLLWWVYKNVPFVRKIAEWKYKFFSYHGFGFRITKLWLASGGGWRESYAKAAWIFRRGIGVIYTAAFLSLLVQAKGLFGEQGILPIKDFFGTLKTAYGESLVWKWPSIFWLSQTDTFLVGVCIAGIIFSICLTVGILPGVSSAVLWVLYLSVLNAGQDFMSFQWDILLLEAGFLAIFLNPLAFLDRWKNIKEPPRAVIYLFKWLLFRLMFMSGMVKLLSGDVAWRDGTALLYHYETQPLANVVSWWIHQAPVWFHKISLGIMYFVELFVPFLIFFPRKVRHFAATALVIFQILILMTGNYCFFNLITILLCVFLLENDFLKSKSRDITPASKFLWFMTMPMAVILLLLSTAEMLDRFRVRIPYAERVRIVNRILDPWRITSGYGLFAVMTKERREIIVEGSDDGAVWEPYGFRYKPGDILRAPGWNVPHQPRLDWQMWFAALGTYKQNLWFLSFVRCVLSGNPEALGLLEKNPFFAHRPKYLRAVVYQYEFTTREERKRTGEWWKRKYLGLYCPVLNQNMI